MIYKERILGVFIQDIDGKLWKPEDWDNSTTADFVAVLTEECSFGIYLKNYSNTCQISNDYDLALDNYMTAISDAESAKTDFDGIINTANIMKMEPSTDCAAGWCTERTSPSGKRGFLPSLGQLNIVYNNLDEVNNALTIAGGGEFRMTNLDTYWSSTFKGTGSMDSRICWTFRFIDGSCGYTDINGAYYVRAFYSL